MVETYRIGLVCTNCNFKDKMELPKGKSIAETLCPKCGCKTLNIFSDAVKEIDTEFITKHSTFWGESV